MDDSVGDFVLDGKNVGQVAIIPICPNMSAVVAIDELTCYAHASARLSNTAFQNEIDAEALRHLRDFHSFALIGKSRVARHDKQPRHLRQISDDVLGNPITKIFLFQIAAHVDEWEDCNRWLFFSMA